MTVFDISTLPAPTIVEDLAYERLFQAHMQEFLQAWQDRRSRFPSDNLPSYDVSMLETDPAVIVGQAESFRELMLRARINDAARANLLAFATKSDLDHLAAFYDVVRLPLEGDSRLKLRVILAIQGRSTGGPKERYKSIIMGADIRVASVEPYRIGRSPLIHIAVYSTQAGGVASPDLLESVRLSVENDLVRLCNDEFVIGSAVQHVANLTADVWLLPDADEGVLERAKTALRSAWAMEKALGRDLVREWWGARLMVAGMHKVVPTAPVGDVIAAPHEAVDIGTIGLNMKGRAF